MTTPPVNDPSVPRIQTYIDNVASDTFPNNIIELSETRFNLLPLDLNVLLRMPRNDDKNYSLGMVPVVSTPNPQSYEIRGTSGFTGTSLKEYLVIYYVFVKDANRERGQAAHGVLLEIVESILESDVPFRQALGMLQSDVMGAVKRYQKHYIRQSRFLANELDGNHLFMAAIETIFEVEKVS